MYKNCLMIIHVSRFIETENNPTFSLPSNQAKHSSAGGKALVTRAEKASSETTLPSGGHIWNYSANGNRNRTKGPLCHGSELFQASSRWRLKN